MTDELRRPCPICGESVRFHGGQPDDDCDGCHHIHCDNCKASFDLSETVDPGNDAHTLADLRRWIVAMWNGRAFQGESDG